jgi:hypothetical protein
MTQNPRSTERLANVFVNYRREDSAGHAGRLFDRLNARFAGRVFMDIEMEPGVDFVDVLEREVGSCQVLIVIIGHEWLSVKDAAGRRRLDNPADYVRLEVAMALQRKIRVIPVLVQGAAVPRAEELPPDLAMLARRNAIELSDVRWAFDVDRLVQVIEEVLEGCDLRAPVAPSGERQEGTPAATAGNAARRGAWIALLAAVVVSGIAWAGWKVATQQSVPVKGPQVAEPVSGETFGSARRWSITSQRRLVDSDLAGLSRADLRLMRNEIYARHGRQFASADLRSYFGAQPWYRPQASFREADLTTIEQYNISFIGKHE